MSSLAGRLRVEFVPLLQVVADELDRRGDMVRSLDVQGNNIAAKAIHQFREIEKLRAFARAVLGHWPGDAPDGFELQELAIKHGMLAEADPRPTEPCSESCECAEHFAQDEWSDGVTCYRRTALLTGKGQEPIAATSAPASGEAS